MEPATIEQSLKHLEQQAQVIRETMATRGDIHSLRVELYKALSAQTWKMVAALIASMPYLPA